MRLSLLATIAALLVATAVAAQPAPQTEQMRQQAVGIATQWLKDNTPYKTIPEIHNWVVLSHEQMAQQAVRAHIPGDPQRAAAIYSCGEDKLYFRNDVNYYDIAILGLLVHELTHHAQCLAHKPMADVCPIEREAYMNQRGFLTALPGRIAAAGPPLSPEVIRKVNAAIAEIDGLVISVCQAAGQR